MRIAHMNTSGYSSSRFKKVPTSIIYGKMMNPFLTFGCRTKNYNIPDREYKHIFSYEISNSIMYKTKRFTFFLSTTVQVRKANAKPNTIKF